MIRFSVFSNERAKSEIESFGFRCTMLETSSRRIVSSPTGRYLSGKENEFIAHVVNDDVVKKTCHDLGMSRSGYYKTLKRILGKLDLESAEQLRSWALVHLSV